MNKVILEEKGKEYFTFEIYRNYLRDFKKCSSWKSLQEFKQFINHYVKFYKG